MNGKPNPTWNHSAVRESSDYLVDMLAAFRMAMHKRSYAGTAFVLLSRTMMVSCTGVCCVFLRKNIDM